MLLGRGGVAEKIDKAKMARIRIPFIFENSRFIKLPRTRIVGAN
jgi:hypothetical protein